jgi:hypothetical protein
MTSLMAIVAGLFPSQWLHPGGSGYWFYSGVFDAGILLAILSSAGVYWRAHNCHVNRCCRLDWHPHPDHDHPVCRLHHPDGGAEFLHARHHRVKRSATDASAAHSSAKAETAPAAHLTRPDPVSGNGTAAAARSDARGGAGEVAEATRSSS